MMSVLAAILVAVVVTLASGPAGPTREARAGVAAALVLNEIHADPDTSAGDANGDGTVQRTGDEFVELVNPGPSALDVSGWTIADTVATRHVFPPGSIVSAGCGVVVFGGGTPTGSFGAALVQTASSGALGLNNGGDTVTVRDGTGVIASYAYGSEAGDNQSVTRDPDVTGPEPLVRHVPATGSGGARFSPGTRVDSSAFAGCSGAPEPTITVVATSTPIPTATATPTVTATPTATATVTATPTVTAAATPIPTGTSTATPAPPPTVTSTVTPPPSATVTVTPTVQATSTPSATVAPTIAATATPAATATAVATVAPTPAATATAAPTDTPVPSATPSVEPTASATLCLALPRAGCRRSTRPDRSTLQVKDHRIDRRDRLDWKWRKGGETAVGDFGDPLGGDDYALCLYDESASVPRLLLAAAIPANDACPAVGGTCWVHARAGARVLRYKSADRSPDGVERMVLKPGIDGKARIILKAGGGHLRVPELPLPLPLRVQLQAAHGTCWETRHSLAGVRRNNGQEFRGSAE